MNFPIPFTKMSGTGNDFIIIDHRQPFMPPAEMSSFAAKVCKRMFSAGADGLILIENDDRADFKWQFFNGDGSVAEMCGNGARCAARYAFAKGIAPARMTFNTQAGTIHAEVIGEQVKLEMTKPVDTSLDLALTIAGEERILHFSNTGVPHVVALVADSSKTPVKEWGREIRFHEKFQPDETMACGTGAVAAGLIAALLGLVASPAQVTTSGGEILTIYFTIDNKENLEFSGIFLEGPANFIYEGMLNKEALR